MPKTRCPGFREDVGQWYIYGWTFCQSVLVLRCFFFLLFCWAMHTFLTAIICSRRKFRTSQEQWTCGSNRLRGLWQWLFHSFAHLRLSEDWDGTFHIRATSRVVQYRTGDSDGTHVIESLWMNEFMYFRCCREAVDGTFSLRMCCRFTQHCTFSYTFYLPNVS